MPKYKYSDLGSEAVDFGTQLAKGAREAACGLWRNYAGNYVPKNPATAPIRWFWNTVCEEAAQPPPPPYTGGQCSGVVYRVTSQRTRYTFVNDVFTKIVDDPVSGDYVGSIGGLRRGRQINQGSGTIGGVRYDYITYLYEFVYNDGDSVVSNYSVLEEFSTPVAPGQGVRILSVTRVDGQPDNCGDLPTQYPRPPQFPPGGITIDVNIEDNDGNILNIPLTYNDLDFNMPVTFNFEGGFINVDIGGITLEWSGDFNIGSGDNGSKSPYPEAPGGGSGGGGRDPQPGDDGVEEKPPVDIEDGEEVEETEEEDEQILWVEILLRDPPHYKHQILYANSDLNVYYGGWLAWTGGKGSLNSAPEIPVRRSRTLVRKPDEYTGYKVRAINGASYTVKSYTQKIIKKPSKESE